MHLAQELLTKVQGSSDSVSFVKEMRGLKMKSAVAGPWKLMTNWEQSLKWILLKLQEKLLKNSTLTIIRSFGICSKLERWKFLISGCLMSWLQIKKIIVLKCRLLLHNKPLLNWTVTCDEKWILYNWCSGWTEKQLPSTSQGQTCTKKGHGHCWMVCCQSDPLQLSESQWNHYIWEVSKLSTLMRCTKNCNACSQHWSTKWAQFSMKMRLHILQPMLQKLNKLGYEALPHLLYSLGLSSTNYFFKHLNNFLQGKWFCN